MTFANPITGQNGALIRQQIESPNFVAGSTGWIVRQNGSAEFNGAVFRGSIVLNNAGDLLIYSTSTPQTNKLVAALAGSSGLDGIGNFWTQGLNLYDASGVKIGTWNSSGFSSINDVGGVQAGSIDMISQSSGSPLLRFKTGTAGVSTDNAIIYAVTDGSGPSSFDALIIQGSDSTNDPNLSAVDMQMLGGGNGINAAHGILEWFTNSASFTALLWDKTGGHLIGDTTAIVPGTSAPPTPETWHTMSLSTGWAALAGNIYSLQYRMLPDGDVELIGAITSTSATPTAIFATLPSGYFNASKGHRIPCVTRVGTTSSADILDIATTGQMQLLTNATATSTQVAINCRFPIT